MKLHSNDKKILETLFNMGGGYVLDFSDRRMTDFFKEEFGIDIYDTKYDQENTSKSKANRLRGIWLIEDEKTVGKIILALIDYLETGLLVEGKQVETNTKNLIQKAREIGARLQYSEISQEYEPFIKAITDKVAIIKNFNSSDFSTLKTNEKIYLLKVLFSYYEAILRAYYGNGLFFLTSGIDDLNDYFKVLRKKIIELFNSDNTFLELKKSEAYTSILEPVTSLYSSIEFMDGIWEDHTYPQIINLREEIADKDLFENNAEIQKVGVAIPIFLEAVSKEIGILKSYIEQKTKKFYSDDLPHYKEKVNPISAKTDVIKHEHTHRFENSVQEKEIFLTYTQEKTPPKTKIKLSDYDISFDDETAQLHIGDFTDVSFPPHKNEHYVLRTLFSYKKGEAVDWEELYEAMTHSKSEMATTEEIERRKKSVRDAVRAINARVMQIANTDSELLMWETKCVKRLY